MYTYMMKRVITDYYSVSFIYVHTCMCVIMYVRRVCMCAIRIHNMINVVNDDTAADSTPSVALSPVIIYDKISKKKLKHLQLRKSRKWTMQNRERLLAEGRMPDSNVGLTEMQ